jgi:phosphoribosylamine--glycine ligase
MKILVVGDGAREDALAWRLGESASCDAVFVAPGNAGTALRHENWSIAATDGRALLARAQSAAVDLVVIGPETAIAAGVADRFREAGIATFGPGRSAGRLESSKIFAKRFMQRHGIPTAASHAVHSLAGALRVLEDWQGACVVKADGLAAGKGVVVANDASAARAVVEEWYASGVPGGGSGVLLEEKLEGREVSVFALGDGRRFVPFASACDYKRAGDGDTGPNTGGMGAYSPPAGFPADLDEIVRERVLEPVARGLSGDNERFAGVLYCGLMWTARGPAVIEFNVRFGDPETQALVPRVRGDFAALLAGAARGTLEPEAVSISEEVCVAVVLAAAGYPAASTPTPPLPSDLALGAGCRAFWGASNLRDDGTIEAKGGRILTITGLGPTLVDARARAYGCVAGLAMRLGIGRQLRCRTDIGIPGLHA